MTTKELKDEAYCEGFDNESEQPIDLYVFTPEEMAIFWSQLCKEQRKLCEMAWAFSEPGEEMYDILEAPEPTFE